MILSALEVFSAPFPKFRLGRDGDGGYIVSDMPGQYDMFLSGGINDDISFEEAFLEKYPDVPCVAYDGTINKLPDTKYPIQFVRENINHMNNLSEIINQYSNIFVKMDIETWEYPWLSSLSHKQLSNIKQLVIEIHFLHEDPERRWPIINKLKETHHLVHIHGNNACGITDQGIPHVIECTYIRKDGISLPHNKEPFPIDIDIKNDISKPQYVLKGYPFTVKRLVCIMAQARTHELTWSQFKKNVLDELDADLALCIGDSYQRSDGKIVGELQSDQDNPFFQNVLFVGYPVPRFPVRSFSFLC